MRTRPVTQTSNNQLIYLIVGIFFGGVLLYFLHEPIDPESLATEHKTLTIRPQYEPFVFSDGSQLPWVATSHGSEVFSLFYVFMCVCIYSISHLSPLHSSPFLVFLLIFNGREITLVN